MCEGVFPLGALAYPPRPGLRVIWDLARALPKAAIHRMADLSLARWLSRCRRLKPDANGMGTEAAELRRERRRLSESALRVRGLRKSYGDVAAVDGVDLDIVCGEVFALLGPNGAGKTTTVEILEGYRRRTGGEVSVLGTDPAKGGREWRSRIGVVPQSGLDAAELTVGELVRHFAGFYPRPAHPGEVIDSVGLTTKAGCRLRQLSGGQRRRVDVALGIIGNPELIFLDEPTTGFDPQARRQFWQLIRSLARDGTTVLLTTHYLDEAEALADRVAVIADGRIRDVAAPDQLGGRASAPATVSWLSPDGRRSIETSTPTTVVGELARSFGGEVPGLTVTRPSLEDVYLVMIGHTPGLNPPKAESSAISDAQPPPAGQPPPATGAMR
jgi:ABC-2 type transport system ATP-binding protein